MKLRPLYLWIHTCPSVSTTSFRPNQQDFRNYMSGQNLMHESRTHHEFLWPKIRSKCCQWKIKPGDNSHSAQWNDSWRLALRTQIAILEQHLETTSISLRYFFGQFPLKRESRMKQCLDNHIPTPAEAKTNNESERQKTNCIVRAPIMLHHELVLELRKVT